MTYLTKTKRSSEVPETKAGKVRLRQVKESASRIKAVLGERRQAFKNARAEVSKDKEI
jgi:hypothetical protein